MQPNRSVAHGGVDSTMPESTCLHIQDRESSSIRVVEIPWISVRIGRGASCEVRLEDPVVAVQACRLQYRGRGWHLVPLGPKGSITLQGQPVDSPCSLPLDVPFRIGSVWLTLCQTSSADPVWVHYRPPSAVTGKLLIPTVPVQTAIPGSSENWSESLKPNQSRVASVTGSTPSFPDDLIPPPEESPAQSSNNPWEARWKAAGAHLRVANKHSRDLPRPYAHSGPEPSPGVPFKEPHAPWCSQTEPWISSKKIPAFARHRPDSLLIPSHPGVPQIRLLEDDESTTSAKLCAKLGKSGQSHTECLEPTPSQHDNDQPACWLTSERKEVSSPEFLVQSDLGESLSEWAEYCLPEECSSVTANFPSSVRTGQPSLWPDQVVPTGSCGPGAYESIPAKGTLTSAIPNGEEPEVCPTDHVIMVNRAVNPVPQHLTNTSTLIINLQAEPFLTARAVATTNVTPGTPSLEVLSLLIW